MLRRVRTAVSLCRWSLCLSPLRAVGVTQSRNHAGLYWQKVKGQGAVYQCPVTPNVLGAVNSALAFSSARAQQHQIVETMRRELNQVFHFPN